MGVILKRERRGMLLYSYRALLKLYSDSYSKEALVLVLITLTQLIYTVCADDTFLNEDGDYCVTVFVAKTVLPRSMHRWVEDVVTARNVACHTYGSPDCNGLLNKLSRRTKDLNIFIQDILRLAESTAKRI